MAENNFVQNATSDIVIDALMGVTDPAAVATDILLDQLIDALVSHYAQAASEIEEKGAKYFNKFKDADAKKFADFQAGKITKEDYTKWRAQKMLTGDHYKDLRDVLVSDMNNANQIATDIINNKKPDVYALNHNYGVYEIEHATGLTTSYTLYDHNTVENLISENPQILPKNKIDIPADKKWNTQKINNALTQGVLQGESIPDISKRLREVTDMNKNAAIRNARTAVTGAQNAGRDDSYKRAESMGIPVDQIWISTIDGRTRHSHRAMMGEVRKGKTFSNGLRYPGDPWGAGEEVYNCRCTMIANVNDVDYGIEDMVNRKLKEKDMTWDEWVNEQPLSKHYNESKTHYLERYSEYKKNLSFSDWLEDQAAPDSLIESAFGNKTWSNLFYEIYDKSHEDANLFKKELTKIANQNGVKPKDIWNQYLTGQLDAEDFNAFETALKKHLPPTESVVNAAQVIDKIDNLDNISDAAKQAESQLKFTKGTPMTKEQADNYKVNPLYDKSNYGSTHNCQTATFAYECRRQGYDVTALPKYVDSNDNPIPGFEAIANRQKQLASNQSNGWINKVSGKPPKMLYGGTVSKENIEKIIGTHGERYSMSVGWNKGGGHVVNIERDEAGIIRVIDNQRGPLEKNTWTLEEYLQKDIKKIGAIYRLDDCVPNPEFFNFIVKDNTSKIGISTGIKNTSENTINVFGKKFTKQDLLKMDDDDLWETLSNIKSEEWLEKFDGPNFKKNVISELFDMEDIASEVESVFGKYSMTAVYNELKNQGLHGEFYNNLLGSMGKPSDVWKKYVANELDPFDAAKIDDFLIKHLKDTGKLDDVVNASKVDDALELFKKNHSTEDLADILDEAGKIGHAFTPGYLDKYFNGDVQNDVLDDLIKKKIANKNINLPDWVKDKDFNLINLQTGEVLDKVKELEKIKNMPITDLDDMAKKLTKDYYDLKIDDAKKMLKESGLNIPEKTVTTKTGIDIDALKNKKVMDIYHELEAEGTHGKFYTQLKAIGQSDNLKPGEVWKKYLNGELNALDTGIIEQYLGKYKIAEKITEKTDDIAAIAKKEIEKIEKTGSSYYSIFNELEKIDTDLAVALNDEILHLKHEEHFINKHETLNAYLNGDLKSDKLDAIFTKFYSDKLPSANKVDNTLDAIKAALPDKMTDLDLDQFDEAKKIIKKYYNSPDAGQIEAHYSQWKKGLLEDDNLDALFSKVTAKADDLAKIKKTLPVNYGDLDNISQDLLDAVDDYFFNNHFSLKDSKIQWEKYVKGEISDPALDKILKDKLPTASTASKAADKVVTTPEVDLFALQNKSMSQVFNELKVDKLNSKFYTELQKHGKPSEVWEKYLNGELTDDASKKIDDILIKKYSKGGVSGQTAKTIQTVENPEELIKAQEKLKKAQEDLEEIKKELAQIPNKTYTGIWKDDVTLADYESKQTTLAAKKQYYYDKIEELDHCIDDPDSWQFKKYGGEEGLNKKIAEYEKYIDDLNDFEIKGKEYLAEKTEIDKKIKKAEKIVADAQDEVRQLTPVGEAFTQERKDNALWAKNKTDEYKKVDAYYDKLAEKIHGAKTSREHAGYYHYTWGSMPFNSPLAGFKGDRYTNFVGVNKVDINVGGYGEKIRGLTSLVEKSKYDKDFWMQSAQGHETIEAFLGIPYGTLRNMTVEEAQQFVGVQNEIPQFISGAVNKYGGTYNPGNMTINIYVPAGSEALYVRNDGYFGKNEHEMILQRGGTYKITKIYKGKGTHGTTEWIVDMEVHPECGYDKFQQTK